MRIARRRCRTSADAEDIVHEAFVRGAEFRDLDLGRLRQFLSKLVVHLCVDEARRQSVERRVTQHRGLLPGALVDPAELACDRAEARWLASRIATLPNGDRQLVLMLTEGLSNRDIAAQLRTTTQCTHSSLYRIRLRVLGVRRGQIRRRAR
ncbi:RNA polymerase sigma factor [Kutzneria albida]|uniref:RNA polymerase sigma factor n=1 Tax=Kutzneria albida TaxID=43357 RepID=UPI00130E8AA9|nr:sigma-70 family RNA polymerase sigma factor [Kutzneria albida]